MAKRKPKSQNSAELMQYGHFYIPKDAMTFITSLAHIQASETILCIGLLESDLKDGLPTGVTLELVGTEEIDNERLAILSNQRFDVILCAPSFGRIARLNNEPEEEMWLKWGLDHLNASGRMVITVPMGLLSNVSQEPIRQHVLDKGALDALIELPNGWAQGTMVQATILYLTIPELPVENSANECVRMVRFQGQTQINWSTLSNEVFKTNTEVSEAAGIRAFSIPVTQLSSKRLDAKFYDPRFVISAPDSDLREIKLGDLVVIRSGERFVATDFDLDGVLFVQVKNIGPNGSLDLHEAKRVNAEKARNSRGYSETDEILISIAGTIGKVALIPPYLNVCIDTSLRRLRVKDKRQVLPEFLFYYLLSETAKLQFERWSSGSVISVLPTPNLEEIVVLLPDIDRQRKLARTYVTALQDRIDKLNAAFPYMDKMQTLLTPVYQASLPPIPVALEEPESSINEVVQLGFPFPIARALRLFDTSHDSSQVARVKKLISVSEAIVYYVYSLFVADHLYRLKFSDNELRQLLSGSLTDYSIDRRLKYIFRFVHLCGESADILPFVPEIIIDGFGICSEIHNNIRNKFSHTDQPEQWCKQQVNKYYPKILTLLRSLVPLTEYRLVQITGVSLRNGRVQHSIKNMMGDNPLFSTQVEDLDTLVPADTDHVVLLDQDYNVLDLNPFYMMHAWEATGMQDHLCYLKQIAGQGSKQKMRLESTLGVGESDVDVDSRLKNQLSGLTL